MCGLGVMLLQSLCRGWRGCPVIHNCNCSIEGKGITGPAEQPQCSSQQVKAKDMNGQNKLEDRQTIKG